MLNVMHSHVMYTDQQVLLVCQALSVFLGMKIPKFQIYKAAKSLKIGHAFELLVDETEPIELVIVHTDSIRVSVYVGSFQNIDVRRSDEITRYLQFALSEPV